MAGVRERRRQEEQLKEQPARIALPHHKEAEKAVLGAMLDDEKALDSMLGRLAEEDFFDPAHRAIFLAMKDLATSGQPVDPVTVSDRLQKAGRLEAAGGMSYLAELRTEKPTHAGVGHYAELVLEKARLRRLLAATFEIQNTVVQEGDYGKAMQVAESRIAAVSGERGKKDANRVQDVMLEVVEDYQDRSAGKTDPDMLTCHFEDLMRILGAFRPGELILVAARPGIGKTTLSLNIMHDLAVRQGKPVALFSLEMGRKELCNNLVCLDACIDSDQWRNDTRAIEERDRRRLAVTFDRLAKAPIVIDDETGLTPVTLHAKLRAYKRDHDVKVAFVDYIQLMSSPEASRENRAQELSHISRAVKGIARELRIPVFAMAQLNRALEARHDKRPTLSDLRESGSLEQDADIVLLLHRPDEHNKEDRPGEVDIIVAKHRLGKRGTATMFFVGSQCRFENRMHA